MLDAFSVKQAFGLGALLGLPLRRSEKGAAFCQCGVRKGKRMRWDFWRVARKCIAMMIRQILNFFINVLQDLLVCLMVRPHFDHRGCEML